jgi:hydroxymethylbilane synthase
MESDREPARTPAPEKIIIASRKSALAMWQARHVQARLNELYPRMTVEILGLTTEGDRRLDVPLAAIGGKGLFVKELEQAIAAGRADIAVHSAKDIPMELPDGYLLAAMLERQDPRDAFVSPSYRNLAELPGGARVGTSSLRRQCQLRGRHPHLSIEPLRGNVDTRVRKLEEGLYDAVILAAAGLTRLGLGHRIASLLEPEECLPAPGQGALAVECRADRADLVRCLAPLNHAVTAQCVAAERAFSRALAGSCNVPLGAYAEIDGRRLRLRGFVGTPDGRRLLHAEGSGAPDEAGVVGIALAGDLKSRGASEILAALQTQE